MCNCLPHPPAPEADHALPAASGYCRACGTVHTLPTGAAELHCRQLIHHFLGNETIDLRPTADSDPRLSTAYLFGPARGKMFGVLECCGQDGAAVIVRAFSGQYDGQWLVPGWAPPLFEVEEFSAVNTPSERLIKDFGRQLSELEPESPAWRELVQKRREMSRQLMRELHGIYRLNNFRGETRTLPGAYTGDGGIPTGTGDCCAPKLLNFAATRNLTPISIAEFYWGQDNRSGSRRHGRFYPSCREKCQPILGFLLCGLSNSHATG